jgi:hypothetical protein
MVHAASDAALAIRLQPQNTEAIQLLHSLQPAVVSPQLNSSGSSTSSTDKHIVHNTNDSGIGTTQRSDGVKERLSPADCSSDSGNQADLELRDALL